MKNTSTIVLITIFLLLACGIAAISESEEVTPPTPECIYLDTSDIPGTYGTWKDIEGAINNGDTKTISAYVRDCGYATGYSLLHMAVHAMNLDSVRFLLTNRANPLGRSHLYLLDENHKGMAIEDKYLKTPRQLAETKRTKQPEKAAILDEMIALLKEAEDKMNDREKRIKEYIAKKELDSVLAVVKEGCVSMYVYTDIAFSCAVSDRTDDVFSKIQKYTDFSLRADMDREIEKHHLKEEEKQKVNLLANSFFSQCRYCFCRGLIQQERLEQKNVKQTRLEKLLYHRKNNLQANDFRKKDLQKFLNDLIIHASCSGELKIIHYLLQEGADPNYVDKDNKSALDYVCTDPYADQSKKEEITKLLKDAMAKTLLKDAITEKK